MSAFKGVALIALILGTGAAIACGSDEENTGGSSSGKTTGGGGGEPRDFFLNKVNGPINETCNKCHLNGESGAPVFLGASGDATYTAIETFPGLISAPNVSPIIQKGIHSGPALTQIQTDLVTQWLSLEIKTRKLGSDPGVPKNLRAAFKAFGACMDYARWKELKLHTIPATNTEGNQGQCRSCHNYGAASMWLSGGTDNPADEPYNALTFQRMSEFPYIQRLVVGRVTTEGSFETIESARRMVDKGTEAQQLQANSHPRYSLSTDLVTALNTYVLETVSNMNAARCTGVNVPDAGLIDAALQQR
jgi:hypothetical protein